MAEEPPLPEVGSIAGTKIQGKVVEATVRFVGPTKFAEGILVGLELPEPLGKNDGSKDGEVYFSCPPNHGIFIRPTGLVPLSSPKHKGSAATTVEAKAAGAKAAGAKAATAGTHREELQGLLKEGSSRRPLRASNAKDHIDELRSLRGGDGPPTRGGDRPRLQPLPEATNFTGSEPWAAQSWGKSQDPLPTPGSELAELEDILRPLTRLADGLAITAGRPLVQRSCIADDLQKLFASAGSAKSCMRVVKQRSAG